MKILSELGVKEAFSHQYREILDVVGIDATVKLHRAFNGRRILCVKHLYDIEFIVNLAAKKQDKKYIERLVFETGYSYDWLVKKIREQRKARK